MIAAAALALVIANSPLSEFYRTAVHFILAGRAVESWVNDGLMAIFFLLVGLEIKREAILGSLSTWRARLLPGAAALGGMIVPMAVYLAVNLGKGGDVRGWAIPAATDIAFALAVLSLAGRSVPASLKVFLTTLAIIDDLGAILIIAVFYTHTLDWTALAGAGLILFIMTVLNRLHVMRLWPYLMLAAGLWWFMEKSGVHATVAGVAAAMTIPARRRHSTGAPHDAPLHRLEKALGPYVAFGVLPLFALVNAGVALGGQAGSWTPPVGVAAGLFFGKQAGIFGVCWLMARFGIAHRPQGSSWLQVYGVSLVCGVGFTMSLFIGQLALPGGDMIKLGIVAGSIASAVAGWAVLRIAARKAS